MKKVFSIIVILSIFLFYAGIVHAEDVPGNSVIFPFLCAVPPAKTKPHMKSGDLRTSFAVAETAGNDTLGIMFLRDPKGLYRLDLNAHWTPDDVITSDCMELVNMMPVTDKEELKIMIAGKQYYAGFVEYTSGGEVLPESLIGWGNFYYTGNRNNTDAGFNGVPNLFDSQWGAVRLLPRYNIANNETNTLNWWIILTPHSQGASCVRILECFICDEQENCISRAILIPNALNVINVADNLPGFLFPGGTFPKAGFALCDVAMQSQVIISNDGCSAIRDDKIVGWLYQYTDGTSLFRDKATMLPIHVQHQSTE